MTSTPRGGPDKLNWDERYAQWRLNRFRDRYGSIRRARRSLGENSTGDCLWLRDALSQEDKKYFVAEVFHKAPLPRQLRDAMLYAGVTEPNPSANKWFILPCLRSFGNKWTCEALLHFIQTGTNEEKAGAVSAFYWTGDPQFGDPGLEVLRRFFDLILREFVSNDSVCVRRRIIPMLRLSGDLYDDESKPLVAQAIAIARSHPDEYIRHRVEIQLGAGGPYMAIPDETVGPITQQPCSSQKHRNSMFQALTRILHRINDRSEVDD